MSEEFEKEVFLYLKNIEKNKNKKIDIKKYESNQSNHMLAIMLWTYILVLVLLTIVSIRCFE